MKVPSLAHRPTPLIKSLNLMDSGQEKIKKTRVITDLSEKLSALDLSSSVKFKEVPRGEVTVLLNNLAVSAELMKKIKGAFGYEERLLCFLIGNRNPMIVLTSREVDPDVAGYYLGLDYNPNESERSRKEAVEEAIRNTWLLSPNSLSGVPLCKKINDRKPFLETLGSIADVSHIGDDKSILLQSYTGSKDVDEVASQLGFQSIESSSKDLFWGSKTGSRKAFEAKDVPHPAGVPSVGDHDLLDERGYIDSIDRLVVAMARCIEQRGFRKDWVVKLNEGFSGKGNAFLTLNDDVASLKGEALKQALRENFDLLRPVDEHGTTAQEFLDHIPSLGAIAEEFIVGESASPSCQALLHRSGEVEILSTHDQLLDGQVYNGCKFPADRSYSDKISSMTKRIGEYLVEQGVQGHIAVDFLATKKDGTEEQLNAIEINLRVSGTSHPLQTLRRLTGGKLAPGGMLTKKGQVRAYLASDNVLLDELKGLPPKVLIREMRHNSLHWDPSQERGVVFHLFSTLEEFGKIGVTAIGKHEEDARGLYEGMVQELKRIGKSYSQVKPTFRV